MDWPSRELSQRLAEWRLCTPQDVQRCRAAVKRFVRDLPSFDSIWIDVLLQKRLLTPYQARILDSANPDRLVVAGHVITDCLEENAWRAVYRARPIGGQTPQLVTVHGVHPEDRTRAVDPIDETIARLRGVSVPGLNIPSRAEVGGRELLIYSQNLTGSPLRELLVRRGRFPEAAVFAIARQLTGALIALEEHGVPHGDLRARNVWLDDHGQVHVLHAGILPAVMPTFLVSQEMPLEVCDGVAPETTGAGTRADSVSDQYSLGCLLWQLLAGRAPFTTGDPHGKVSAHRTKAVPDVRDVAPQVSERLGRIVTKLTSRARADRYASFRELALQFGSSTRQDRRQLARFHRTFETDAPTQTARIAVEKSRQLPSAIAAVLIGGATVWLFTSDPASFATRPYKRAESTAPKPLPQGTEASPINIPSGHDEGLVIQTAGVRRSSMQPLPAPDAAGVITLAEGAEYTPRAVKVAGPVVIRATGDGPARVVIRDAPWELTADAVEFENVQLECGAPIRLQSRGLKVLHCAVMSPGESAAIEWQPQDAASISPGTILVSDSHVSGFGLSCGMRPSLVRLTNCLKTGGGPMFVLPATGRSHQATPVQAIHVTLRGPGPLLEWAPGSRAAGLRVDFSTKACVFAPESGASVLALTGSLAPPEWERTISVSGLESLLQSGARLVDLAPAKGKPRGAIDTSKLDVDGVMTATVEFFGPNSEDAASCGLKSTDAIFSVDKPPGIEVAKVARQMSGK